MFRSIVAVRREGRDIYAFSILFEVPNEEFDLLAAAKAAAEDFCKTLEGQMIYSYNCDYFDWSDFAMYVSNDFCTKHGFRKVEDVLPDEVVEWEEQLVEDYESVCGEDEP